VQDSISVSVVSFVPSASFASTDSWPHEKQNHRAAPAAVGPRSAEPDAVASSLSVQTSARLPHDAHTFAPAAFSTSVNASIISSDIMAETNARALPARSSTELHGAPAMVVRE
jgi:hypothetical protein